MTKMLPTTCFLATIALGLGGLGCGSDPGGEIASPGGAAHPLVGKPAPEFTAEKVAGEGPASLKEASGKVVIVDFWATYCAPCKKSFPKYQELVDQFAGDLAVIAVSVDEKDDVTKEQIEDFAKETGVKFAIVWDKEKSAAGTYSPPKMPSSFVVDKTGTIRHLHAGYESGEEAKIAEEIKALLQ